MDRLLRWVKDIRSATYFDIQNVADYYFQYPEDKWDNGKDFTLAPPFDFFATRYNMPTNYPAEYAGLEILTVFRVVDRPPRSGLDLIVGDSATRINPHPPALVPGAKWHLAVQTFSVFGRRPSAPVDWFLAVTELGQMASYRGHVALWVVDTHNPYQIGILADTFIQVSFLALTFLHCKNTQVITPPSPTRKRLPRKLKFESRYHRLKVNAIGAPKRPNGPPAARTGISQGLHIVRGHFREYGPEFGKKGLLFGKYAGRYWVAAHTSGSLEAGLVTKDYEIEAPDEGGQ